jgi:D-alanyl-D-alanine carboxypeptidase
MSRTGSAIQRSGYPGVVAVDASRRAARRLPELVCVLVACLAAGGSAAQARASTVAPPPEVARALDQLVADGIPGTIALGRQGEQEWHATAGVADLKTQRPIRPDDRFRIGSMTKAFVSTTALQLVAERRLSLGDSVERWLPGVVPNGDAITVRELMNHTSGLYDYVDLPFYVQLLKDPLKRWQPMDLVRRAVAHPPLFAPGTSWSYSNTNYILLGLIVAAVDGAGGPLQVAAPAFEVYRRIVGPLRLRHTTFPLVDPDIHGRHAHGYAIGLPPVLGLPPILDTTLSSPSWAWTAGAIISTLDDVADFHRALFTGRLLAPDEQRELQTTVPAAPGVDYGLGVFELQTPCGVAWGHNGGTPSSVSVSLSSPDGAHQAVMMLTRDGNSWNAAITTDYSVALLTAFCGSQPPPASTRQVATALAAVLPSSPLR